MHQGKLFLLLVASPKKYIVCLYKKLRHFKIRTGPRPISRIRSHEASDRLGRSRHSLFILGDDARWTQLNKFTYLLCACDLLRHMAHF
jgi:hypothetical protein